MPYSAVWPPLEVVEVEVLPEPLPCVLGVDESVGLGVGVGEIVGDGVGLGLGGVLVAGGVEGTGVADTQMVVPLLTVVCAHVGRVTAVCLWCRVAEGLGEADPLEVAVEVVLCGVPVP